MFRVPQVSFSVTLAAPELPMGTPLTNAEFVALDLETTGLDTTSSFRDGKCR
ncbi:MAG: hypothetical protein ABIP48_11280 [Planctomycetota bacterium]